MPAEIRIGTGLLYGFLLVLARISGVFAFVPLPGFRSGPDLARAALAVSVTLALAPRWPRLEAVEPTPATLAAWLASEAALGVLIGLAVAMLLEAVMLGAQVVGLQAGYAYASVVDPTTQADSGVLLVVAQLFGGLLFLALGLDREVLRIVAGSLEAYPPSAYRLSVAGFDAIARLGGAMFSTGLRLAMPALALLLIVDVALALLGRLNAQLQLLTLAFPVKMLGAVALLAWTAVVLPRVLGGLGRATLASLRLALRI